MPNEDEYGDEPIMIEITDNTIDLEMTRKVIKIESETFTIDPNTILFTDDFEDSFSKELSTITISSNKLNFFGFDHGNSDDQFDISKARSNLITKFESETCNQYVSTTSSSRKHY